ncbi:hypothetical protein SPRG_14542 [Saprolegnia parasitica CBS 223.65]|uniref:C3H1-type domain-containing protein n=1 Tax=Saprolegnia parasitica (strain CBS 223.65) TaxID=695850 RepID=A0A067BZA9_SAPPC|nr:hypothetical protein SPRG_14542 [Saprolegnia parasitica CBS 223.65]KDO19641.1 hypothetical protein SPRG_14542 [Saprolegnia parasitica CBS 223.65]|eukprot:XP_012209642.1 hypothetical protein SPRG_14542 [Saprolegnia parasitica CBS 223.65]
MTSTSAQRTMQVLANGDIVDCARLPNSARNTLYKTELCKHFTETGTCRYGSKCQFAHGEDELRGVLRHPKYKTTKCKAFLATGKCMYGGRCRFIHDSSPEEDNSDDEAYSMTRAEQDAENMKGRGRPIPRVNPSRHFYSEPDAEGSIDLSCYSAAFKLQPVHACSFPPFEETRFARREYGFGGSDTSSDHTPSMSDDESTLSLMQLNLGNNQIDDDIGAGSRLSIFQRICRASD